MLPEDDFSIVTHVGRFWAYHLEDLTPDARPARKRRAVTDGPFDPEGIHLLLHQEGRFQAFLRSRLGSADCAEDILQSAYLRSLEKVGQVRDEENIVAWFYALLRNAIADHFRAGRLQSQDAGVLELIEAPRDPDLQRSSEDCVRVAMRALRVDEAELITWVDLRGIEVSEAAERLSVPPKIVSQRLFRARQALRKRLQEMCRSCTATRCLYCRCPEDEAR